ncbi:hypothetical protein JCM19294_2291 [Nonlabens tegetincola]|uniref:Uncharacterized protein n=1 Tax=Nonlabens tegetincola TaxID=323273 RepID=A0A090PXF7_9FLAO|nr:hypothetical protein [Nonlabens tegetincola]GAK95509.1 hypothetical protein JCM19294_2291 [Nonlabens tegetincola]
MRQEGEMLKILSLKDKFTPVELATQLTHLVEQDIVSVDWKEGLIKIIGTKNDIFLAKTNLIKYERNVPDYMKSDKIEINKPYI